MLHVQLLGPLQVLDDAGRDVTPPGTRERNGLATLAVVSPESLSTERLAGELYRERGTSDPRNAVQAMVSRLRRALGRAAGSVETTANGYRLVEVTVDVDEAERLLREAAAEDDLSRTVELLDQARSLWHGSTLDGLEGELIEAERLRIDGLRHDVEDIVLDRRVHAGTGPADDTDLVNDLEAAVRDEPLREHRWELLMLSLYRIGRQADALRAYQRARELLAEHLGLEPGPSLVDLERRILDHDPTLDQREVVSASEPMDGEPSSPDLPAGTLTLLLTDIVGAVHRWETDPVQTAEGIAQVHDRWTAEVEAENGVVVKSLGDGIMAVFATADEAIRAAGRAMAEQTVTALSVRAAVHSGPLKPDGNDYRGPVVNRCARILDLVGGGQIVVSGPAAELSRGHLSTETNTGSDSSRNPDADHPERLGLRELGSHWLRDVPEPMDLWQVTGPGLPSSFPPLPSIEQTSLPRLRGRLLGRDRLVERVAGLVGEDRLVTLLGPGGIGKTSTAVAVGWAVLGGRPVSFVDLARVDDPAVVPERLVEAVIPGHDDDTRSPTDRLIDRMSSSTELIIIDNAEHVLDAVATLVDDVLTAQLKGSFLITSRQPLGLTDEVLVGVPPLDVPDDGDDLGATGRSPSVALFLERAKTIQPEFSVADGLLPVVAHICRRLDGIPLAIELAAGRATLLSVQDIAARLDDQLRLLRQVRSQRDRRHRSLEAVVRWSVDQLSPPAREAFERISVMAGSFGLEGLEALLDHCGVPGVDALDAVDELYGASLVAVEHGGSRFRMLEPIRQFAAAELEARGVALETRRAHVQWVTSLASDAHGRRDASRPESRRRLDDEADQVLAALSWIADAGQGDLAGDLAYPVGWWFLTRDARAGERVLQRLLDLVDRESDPMNWAKVVLGLGMATAANPRSAVAGKSLQAVEIFDEHDHPDRGLVRLAALFAQTEGSDPNLPRSLLAEADQLIAADDRLSRALIDMTSMIMQSMRLLLGTSPGGDPDFGQDLAAPIVLEPELFTDAVERGRKAAAAFREFNESWALGTTLGELGRLYQQLGDIEAAEACYIESLGLFEGSNAHSSHYILTELARMATDCGHHDRAARLNADALRIARLDGDDTCVALALAGQAYSAEAQGEIGTAVSLYRQALDIASESMVKPDRLGWQQSLDRLVAQEDNN